MDKNISELKKRINKVNQERRNKTPLIKEKIIKAIERKNSYIPKSYSRIAPETILKKGHELLDILENYPDDFIDIDAFPIFIGYTMPNHEQKNYYELISEDNEWIDEWGTKMSYRKNSVGAMAIGFPLKDWHNYNDYMKNKMPLASDSGRLSDAKKQLEKITDINKKYIIGRIVFGIIERAQLLRPIEDIFLDLYLNKKMLKRLIRELTNYHLSLIEEWSYLNVDAIYLTDDWGGQNNLLISPEIWRQFFKPYYQEISDCIHKNNMHFFFHSCGSISSIIKDLIEVGVDVLHPIQPHCNDYKIIAKEFSKNLTVMGGLDVQNILVNGTKDNIKKSLYDFVEIFTKHGCGVILSPTNTIVPDTPIENIKVAFETMKNITKGNT